MARDYTPVAQSNLADHLGPDEVILSVLALNRNQVIVGLIGGLVAQRAIGALAVKGGALPFARANVVVLTNRRFIVLARLGRTVGKGPGKSIPFDAVSGVEAGKTFDRRPTVTFESSDGKKTRLITLGPPSLPFVTAWKGLHAGG
jgi:hypothetical protein